MNTINISKYEIKEIIQHQDDKFDDFIEYLLGILNDRSIPEKNKRYVRKQFDEVMRIKSITMKPPTFILSLKEDGE